MSKKIKLDKFEQDIEDNFELSSSLANMADEISTISNAARQHSKRRKSVTLRIHELDLEAIRIKASKLGLPYQTYINMLIHQDVVKGL